jgi:hypothetical protein
MSDSVLIIGTLAVGLVISVGMNAALVVHVMRVSRDLSGSMEGLAAAARWMEEGVQAKEEAQ